MGYYCIWDFNGPNKGEFVSVPTQAACDAAETAGWGQDARKWQGNQLLPVGTIVLPPDPPPAPPEPPPPGDEPTPAPTDPVPPPPSPPADPDPTDCDTGAKAHHGRGAKNMQAGETYATRHIETAPLKRGRGRPRKAA